MNNSTELLIRMNAYAELNGLICRELQMEHRTPQLSAAKAYIPTFGTKNKESTETKDDKQKYD